MWFRRSPRSCAPPLALLTPGVRMWSGQWQMGASGPSTTTPAAVSSPPCRAGLVRPGKRRRPSAVGPGPHNGRRQRLRHRGRTGSSAGPKGQVRVLEGFPWEMLLRPSARAGRMGGSQRTSPCRPPACFALDRWALGCGTLVARREGGGETRRSSTRLPQEPCEGATTSVFRRGRRGERHRRLPSRNVSCGAQGEADGEPPPRIAAVAFAGGWFGRGGERPWGKRGEKPTVQNDVGGVVASCVWERPLEATASSAAARVVAKAGAGAKGSCRAA